MASLTGSTIASSYEQLLSLPDGGLNGNTLVAITDGDSSTAIGMKVATSKIEIIPASDDANAFEVSKADGTAVLTVNTSTVGATLIGALTVGVDDAGHDVIFYGNTASSNMTWDTSADDLILNDSRLLIDQDDDAVAFEIDSEQVSDWAAKINGKYGLAISQDISSGLGLSVDRNLAEAGSLPLVRFRCDDANNTQAALLVQQDGAGIGINLDTNANARAIDIDAENTTEPTIGISSDVLTTGSIIYAYSNSDTSNNRALVEVVNDHTSATGAIGLKIKQDAAAYGMSIDQNGNDLSIYVDTEATTANGMLFETDALTTGKIAHFHSGSTSALARNDYASANSAIPLSITQDGNANSIIISSTNASLTTTIHNIIANGRSSNSGYNFVRGYTGGDDDIQFVQRGDGVSQNRSGTFEAADYAEYFESKDGSKIAVGTTVKLDGDKIVACSEGDIPLGVVRPLASSIVGNASWSTWQGKYLMDDYGSPIMEEYTVTQWIDGKSDDGVNDNDIQYQTDKIPDDVTVPDDATVTSEEKDGSKLMRKKLNPDYDKSAEYEPRENRDEWHIVGLLGQIPITKGQPMADSWIKMKDISDTVEMYFVK